MPVHTTTNDPSYESETEAPAEVKTAPTPAAWVANMPGAPSPEEGYADDDRVTVLHGWGKIDGDLKHSMSAGGSKDDKAVFYHGVGGVYRNVRYAHAKYWRQTLVDEKGRTGIIILPVGASEVDFARASGIQPMDIRRLAAMVLASDPAKLAAAIGPERLAELAQTLIDQQPQPSTPPQRKR